MLSCVLRRSTQGFGAANPLLAAALRHASGWDLTGHPSSTAISALFRYRRRTERLPIQLWRPSGGVHRRRAARRTGSGRDAGGTSTGADRGQPDHPVADRDRGEIPPGGARFEAGRGHHVPLPGDVVQPAADGVDRDATITEPRPLRRVRRAAGPRPPCRQSQLHRLALEHKTEARALSGLVVAAAGPGAESGSRVGPLHLRFGLAVHRHRGARRRVPVGIPSVADVDCEDTAAIMPEFPGDGFARRGVDPPPRPRQRSPRRATRRRRLPARDLLVPPEGIRVGVIPNSE